MRGPPTSPASLISIYPHPIRLVTPPPQPLPCIRRSSPTPVLSSDSSQFFPQTLPSSFLRLSPVLPSDSPQFFPQALPITLDRGRYRHGGGADGEGAESPLPCLYFQYARIPHPCTSSYLRLFPLHWTVGGIPTGEGQTGRGQKPPPLSLLSICSHPPPRPASGLLPRPARGGGSRGDTRGKAVSGAYPHYTGPWAEGAESPLPCLYFQYAHIPHPARPPATSPAPPEAGAVMAIPGERPYPGRIPITLDRGRRGQKASSPVSASNMPASPTPPGLRPPPRPGRSGGSHGDTRGKAVSGAYPHYTGSWGVSPRGSKND